MTPPGASRGVAAPVALQWFDYADESIEQWLEYLAEHPEGAPPDDDPEELANDGHGADVLGAQSSVWNAIPADTLFGGAFPTWEWLCGALQLGRGRPCGLLAAPSAGKTVTAYSLALSVATGRPFLDRFPCKRGRVLILSYDVGEAAAKLRLRQLANGMGLKQVDLEDRIEVCVAPSINLTTGLTADGDRHAAKETLIDAFAGKMRGFDLVVCDTMRHLIAGVDENSSAVSEHLAILNVAAQRAGCVVLYLHHLTKAAGSGVPTLEQGRGSGALAADSGAVLGLGGRGDEPRTLVMLKPHEMAGGMFEPIGIKQITETTGAEAFDTGDFFGSLRLEACAAASDAESGGSGGKPGKRCEPALFAKVSAYMAERPEATMRQVQDAVTGNNDAKRIAHRAVTVRAHVIAQGWPGSARALATELAIEQRHVNEACRTLEGIGFLVDQPSRVDDDTGEVTPGGWSPADPSHVRRGTGGPWS